MQYEVEQKFPVADLADFERKLQSLGATVGEAVQQMDCYFAHPARDFAQTDEALRIRRQDDHHFITYKGPKVNGTTKTRRELQLPLPSGQQTVARFTELLTALGFRLVAEVHKVRRYADVAWQEMSVEVALDEVQGVGSFVELELAADEEGLEEARSQLASLAERLELHTSERRSYLELLLERG